MKNISLQRNINFNNEEKERFLPSFFIAQILDVVSLEKLKFSKAEIAKTKLLRKWHFLLEKKNIAQLTESDRFALHKELEMFLPTFIFHLPQNLRLNWLSRWRDSDDKLFHPSNLLNGEVIKKNLKHVHEDVEKLGGKIDKVYWVLLAAAGSAVLFALGILFN